MKGFVTDGAGNRWGLPIPTAWQMEYTAGVPCDSFWMRCPWEPDNTEKPSQWIGFTAEHEGERVFTGVIDECEVSLSAQGSVLEVSGRGMAALLLDNQAMGQDYQTATQADILRDHVTPYGIVTAPGAALTPVSQFSVATGSSEWSVVYEFARYYGGIAPRFDRMGQLVLAGWAEGQVCILGDSAPVTQLVCRDKRYGVLSQILMRDRFSGAVHTVDNSAFLASGGRARRVVTMPGRSNYKAMRYTGQFQLDKAASELERLEVTVAQPFCAWPGDLVQLKRAHWTRNGLFRVVQVTVAMDNQGYWSQLELAQPDFLV